MDVDEVVAPGELGEFGVLPGHRPFITTLVPGELRYKDGASYRSLIVHAGIAHVNEDVISILVDEAEDPEKVDKKAARKELNDLEYKLKTETLTEEEAAELLIRIKLAKLRLGSEYYEKPIH